MEADSLDRDDETDFWHEVDRVLAKPCKSAGEIDEVLREFLELTVKRQGGLIQHDSDVYQCLVKLLTSSLFEHNAEYIRLQFIHCFLQEEEASSLYIFALFLLVDGQHHEDTFIIMSSEGAFPHVLKLIQSYVNPEHGSSVDLNRILLDLTYEMARIQRLRTDDLSGKLVLNEQFLLATNDLLLDGSSMPPPTNRVIKILCKYGNQYKTFGENIILLLNRESETSLQLLVLKFLYLLFTTPPTYEYFYTNDLHVLVDILIRNLYDLPEDHQSLRHTYLRVLFPLLANTQLKYPPHYKRQEVKRLLGVLSRKQLFDDVENTEIAHFEEVDETTRRLVRRCSDIHWLVEEHVNVNNGDTGSPEEKAAAATPDSLAEKKAATDSHTQAPDSPKPHNHAPPILLETDGTRPLTKVATCPDIAAHSNQTLEDNARELIMNLPVRSGSVPPVHEPGGNELPASGAPAPTRSSGSNLTASGGTTSSTVFSLHSSHS
ncbi:hypothetical protein KEM56_007097 [Ascosphaera pollenicola]|nr:hypothetical protein KEM56_007097 [Ascosphaera pollenicola]